MQRAGQFGAVVPFSAKRCGRQVTTRSDPARLAMSWRLVDRQRGMAEAKIACRNPGASVRRRGRTRERAMRKAQENEPEHRERAHQIKEKVAGEADHGRVLFRALVAQLQLPG